MENKINKKQLIKVEEEDNSLKTKILEAKLMIYERKK